VHNSSSTVVEKAKVLEPAVVPAPCKTEWEDESSRDEGEEDIGIYLGSLSYAAGGDRGHEHAETEVKDEQ